MIFSIKKKQRHKKLLKISYNAQVEIHLVTISSIRNSKFSPVVGVEIENLYGHVYPSFILHHKYDVEIIIHPCKVTDKIIPRKVKQQ